MTICPVFHKKSDLELCEKGSKDCKACLYHQDGDIITSPAPKSSAQLLPENKTMFDVTLLDNATILDALLVCKSVLTLEQNNTVLSSEVEFSHVTGTARVTLAEFIGHALGNLKES